MRLEWCDFGEGLIWDIGFGGRCRYLGIRGDLGRELSAINDWQYSGDFSNFVK